MGSIHIYIPPRRKVRDSKPFTAAELEDLADRMAAALEELMGWGTKDEFKESEHPRKSDGKFGNGGGGAAAEASAPAKPTSIKAKSAKAGLHELLSSGHAFSKQELISILGVSEKRFSDYMAMVKNPKYAGKEGALTIERNEKGEYFVKRQEGKEAPNGPGAAPPSPPAPKPPEAPPAQPPAPLVTRAPSPRPKPPAAPPAGAQNLMGDKDNEKRFHKVPVKDLRQAFDDHYGAALVHIDDMSNKKKLLASMEAEHLELYRLRGKVEDPIANAERSYELSEAIRGLKRELKGAGTGASLLNSRAHTPVDLESGSAKAKHQRIALHHTALAFDHLESQGVPVKELLKKHGIKLHTGSPRATNHKGHALPGEFAMNGGSIMDTKYREQQQQHNIQRAARGMPMWSRSSDPNQTISEAAQSTAIHELAHAIGMKMTNGSTSPSRLRSLFQQLHSDGHLGQSIGMDPATHAREWIKKNISEYAATNWNETDAELCATVLGKGYKQGTLPTALEKHVHQLFEKQS